MYRFGDKLDQYYQTGEHHEISSHQPKYNGDTFDLCIGDCDMIDQLIVKVDVCPGLVPFLEKRPWKLFNRITYSHNSRVVLELSGIFLQNLDDYIVEKDSVTYLVPIKRLIGRIPNPSLCQASLEVKLAKSNDFIRFKRPKTLVNHTKLPNEIWHKIMSYTDSFTWSSMMMTGTFLATLPTETEIMRRLNYFNTFPMQMTLYRNKIYLPNEERQRLFNNITISGFVDYEDPNLCRLEEIINL